jgi:histidyl-tRNA synthetase
MQKPSIPKGTRDFTPQEMANRNYIFNTIKDVFRLYGFQQIETPAMENLSTLMGKYGEEGDKLLFKILDSGEFLNNVESGSRGLSISEIKNILALDNDKLFDALNAVAGMIKTSATIIQIERDYLEQNKSIELKNLRKFIFYRNSIDLRNKEEVVQYFKGLTVNKVKGHIKNSIQQSRKGLFKESTKIVRNISEKGLRYDLTVPFARFVVQHQNEISFPFKRYQIQPVWRADRPQKGRYREFYQCDVDVVGSDSLLNELELIQIVDDVYRRLKINVCLKINNRKILSGIAEIIGEAEKITDITVAIDKMDKIGLEKVNEEIASKGISDEAIAKLQPILKLSGTNTEKLNQLKTVLADSEVGLKGVSELETIFGLCEAMKVQTQIELDLTLARGLNYYTGAIFEVKALDVEIGSITGGGRYDNLTGVFGLEGVSGVGISFGADRIYDVLNQLKLYPETSLEQTQVLFVSFGEKELMYCLPWLSALRAKGINAEVYPEPAKMKKQMTYADNKRIPFVAIVGETEMNEGKVMLKNMKSGEQGLVSLEEALEKLS